MNARPGIRALLCACALFAATAAPVHAGMPPDEAASANESTPAQIFMEICAAPDRRPESIHQMLIARGAEVISNPQTGTRGYAATVAGAAYSVMVGGELDCGMIFRKIDADVLLRELDRRLAVISPRISAVDGAVVGSLPEATLVGARLMRQPEAPAITFTVHRIGERIMVMRSVRPSL